MKKLPSLLPVEWPLPLWLMAVFPFARSWRKSRILSTLLCNFCFVTCHDYCKNIAFRMKIIYHHILHYQIISRKERTVRSKITSSIMNLIHHFNNTKPTHNLLNSIATTISVQPWPKMMMTTSWWIPYLPKSITTTNQTRNLPIPFLEACCLHQPCRPLADTRWLADGSKAALRY